jgi:hypothetical protein
LDRLVVGGEKAVLSIGQAMPSVDIHLFRLLAKFRGVRTFAQMLKRVAVGNYLDGAASLREAPLMKASVK